MNHEPKKPTIIPRRTKKEKKKGPVKKCFDVQVIPARNPVFVDEVDQLPRKRVAAYCRVSTEEEAQASSFALQVEYYTKLINEREDWVLADIYADEGISGTQTKHRANFNRMIEDCRDKKIDMIITKSISRFARNVVDCISTVRMLKEMNPPVSVYFEKERIDSMDEKMEVFLTMMASFAQEESRSISTNISWAIRNRMKDGTQKIVTNALFGYDTDDEYNMVIVEEEAKVVRTIYHSFIKGSHPSEIAERLNDLGFTTVFGNPWTAAAIKNILRNEKYCGNVIMQKTFTVSYLTHKTKRNTGERDQYFIEDHHPGIVTHEEWDAAQERLEKIAGKRRKKKVKQQRLIPLKKGHLRGFIPISPEWTTLSHTRLVTATEKLISVATAHGDANDAPEQEPITESEEMIMAILEGFAPINLVETKGESVMTVTPSSIKFNKATAVELGYPAYARLLVNAKENKVALQGWPKKDDCSFEFSSPEGQQTYAITVKVPALLVEFRRYLAFEQDGKKMSYTLQGTLYPEEKVIIYNIGEATPAKSRAPRKKTEPSQTAESEAVQTAE